MSFDHYDNPASCESLFAERHCIFVSPHADDICFSLGFAIDTYRPCGRLVTVFSCSRFAPTLDFKDEPTLSRSHRVTAIRTAEDMAFADIVGLTYEAWGLPEPALRGRRPFGEQDMEQEAELGRMFLQRIADAANVCSIHSEKPILVIPIGIGNHIDHLALFRVAWSNLMALKERYFVCFYEDLPYAAQAPAPHLHITALKRLGAVRLVHPVDTQHLHMKKQLVEIYASQAGVFPVEHLSATEAAWITGEPRE